MLIHFQLCTYARVITLNIPQQTIKRKLLKSKMKGELVLGTTCTIQT